MRRSFPLSPFRLLHLLVDLAQQLRSFHGLPIANHCSTTKPLRINPIEAGSIFNFHLLSWRCTRHLSKSVGWPKSPLVYPFGVPPFYVVFMTQGDTEGHKKDPGYIDVVQEKPK